MGIVTEVTKTPCRLQKTKDGLTASRSAAIAATRRPYRSRASRYIKIKPTEDWTSVIAKGTAAVANDDETVQTALAGLFEKYRKVLGSPLSRGGMQPISSFPHVVSIEISELTGMSSSGPFSMRTRPGRL